MKHFLIRKTRRLRYSVRQLFSAKHKYELAVLDERRLWEGLGYDFDHIIKGAVLVPENGAVFVPVHKAANTSVKHSLATKTPEDAGERRPLDIHRNPADYGLRLLWQAGISPEELRTAKRRSFTVVRHPVDRFWSAYRHLCVEYTSYKFAHQLAAFLGLDGVDHITPQNLLDYVQNQPNSQRDAHVREQWSVNGAGLIDFDLVGKSENLEAFYEEGIALGLLPEPACQPNSRHNKTSHAAGRNESRPQAITRRLEQLYAKDFEIFGYEA